MTGKNVERLPETITVGGGWRVNYPQCVVCEDGTECGKCGHGIEYPRHRSHTVMGEDGREVRVHFDAHDTCEKKAFSMATESAKSHMRAVPRPKESELPRAFPMYRIWECYTCHALAWRLDPTYDNEYDPPTRVVHGKYCVNKKDLVARSGGWGMDEYDEKTYRYLKRLEGRRKCPKCGRRRHIAFRHETYSPSMRWLDMECKRCGTRKQLWDAPWWRRGE